MADDAKAKFKGKYTYANGKRKTSIAKVRLYSGTGRVLVNNTPLDEYADTKELAELVRSPLKLTKKDNDFDISVHVIGGGKSAQAQAIRHGISKALVEHEAELRPTLKKAKFLTRDPRSKERKKFGLKKARRSPQFSKR